MDTPVRTQSHSYFRGPAAFSRIHDLKPTVANFPSTSGQHFYWQSTIYDAGAAHPSKAAQSNALDLMIGGNK